MSYLSACYPNGTIKVINPDAAIYTDVVAVQYEGSSSAAECSVAANGDEIMLTECAEVRRSLDKYF